MLQKLDMLQPDGLSVCLSVCECLLLVLVSESVSLRVSQLVSLSSVCIYQYANQPVCLSVCLLVSQLVSLSVYLYVYLSLPASLSVCL